MLPLVHLIFCLRILFTIVNVCEAWKISSICNNRRKAAIISVLVSTTLSTTTGLFPVICYSDDRDTISSTALIKTQVQTNGILELTDGEAARIFRKARQLESDGDEASALKLYEQIVQAEPAFVYGWSNLGNVLAASGSLDQALLCYKKAISLHPPKESLAIIILNKASVENGLDHLETALNDLNIAEAVAGPTQTILSNKAVTLSKLGRWKEAGEIFEKIISSSDRYALPWWLRYSMALFENDRGIESVAYLQRVLNRFPEETECKAYAAALYTALGSRTEGLKYWATVSPTERDQYTVDFVENKLKWGSKAISSFAEFRKLL